MSSTPGSHSLAFRVMRLCRPSFQVDHPLKLDPLSDLLFGEDLFDNGEAIDQFSRLLSFSEDERNKSRDMSYWRRFVLENPSDAMGLSGLLVVPQSFGAIYLGETFCSYISINNSSNFEVRDVTIKAEIQTERQRLLLLDTSKSPVESIRSGGRYDFIVEHDVKELGPHTLVCTALYHDGDGERKYLPQYFKFAVANPLSVRTKVRSVKENTFLEACIENHTKSNLYMDQVEFEPAQHWTATILKADTHSSEAIQPREVFKPPVLIRAGGGIRNYLYQLTLSSPESAQMKVEGSNIFGKLQITWRTNLGEPGRLQTQQILGSPISHKEIELQIGELPSIIILDKPFLVHLILTNHTERRIGPFEVSLSGDESPESNVVYVNGLWKLALPQLEALSSMNFNLSLIATRLGVQKISGITVLDAREKKIYDSLPTSEIFVSPD
ncbi:probable trafficking protein particle complex subunit 13 homolog [Amborella trichopoda]|uniref:probable trafficking protein particle complex subunit 13 homolog n=1 Tax=Amborella trichopoda TaxID=13333 RepID=UPI0005D2D5F5|nr:probable trafficking protein particle complex subunit 13 homolog [Amborella trichopoda]|eukprot:XP_011625579.1 probable trafficking protein particle complex subunit 13 homolog [Amborella trichopoda]